MLLFLLLWLVMAGSCWADLGTCTSSAFYTELSTDPAVLGYSTAYGMPVTTNSAGNDAALLEVVNAIRQGAAYQVNRGKISGLQFQTLLDPTEYTALTQTQLMDLSTMFNMGLGFLDITSTNVRQIVGNIFPAGGPTRTAITAYVNRQGSRAEVLCGAGTVPTLSDVSYAIRGTR